MLDVTSDRAHARSSWDPIIQLPASVPAVVRKAVEEAADAWRASLGTRLVSLVVFGSVARGDVRDGSDIDLLVVAEGFPTSLRARRAVLLAEWEHARARQGLATVEWNLVTKSPEEARHHSPLYLDMVEDGVVLVDRDGFFQSILDAMRLKMRELGSRRVDLPDGSWYWDLKPDFRPGEVVEI